MAQAPIKGYARILVSDDLTRYAPVEIKKPLAGRVAWGWMEVKELFDTFQGFLLLPDSYTITHVFFDIVYRQWSIIVESDTLPVSPPDEMLPLLMPKYQRTDDGKVSIVDLQLLK